MQDRLIKEGPDTHLTQQNVLDRTEPEVELLVAYLDGELDGDAVRVIEGRLSQEPVLREKMTALEQTWNMLGSLETVPVDKTLVRTTMEVVALTIEKELSESEEKIENRKTLDTWLYVAVVVMFGIVGYQLTSLIGIRVSEQMLDDVPVIEQMEYYKDVDDIDFLRALTERKLFAPGLSDGLSQTQTPVKNAEVPE